MSKKCLNKGELCEEWEKESEKEIDRDIIDDDVIDDLERKSVILCIGIYKRKKMKGGKMRVVDEKMKWKRKKWEEGRDGRNRMRREFGGENIDGKRNIGIVRLNKFEKEWEWGIIKEIEDNEDGEGEKIILKILEGMRKGGEKRKEDWDNEIDGIIDKRGKKGLIVEIVIIDSLKRKKRIDWYKVDDGEMIEVEVKKERGREKDEVEINEL